MLLQNDRHKQVEKCPLNYRNIDYLSYFVRKVVFCNDIVPVKIVSKMRYIFFITFKFYSELKDLHYKKNISHFQNYVFRNNIFAKKTNLQTQKN